MAPRRTFGHTWWGKAWIEALEQRARLDPNRLPRGRTYARKDRASDVVVQPGRITALVQGSRIDPYHVTIRIPMFTDEQWALVVAAIVVRAAHAAAMFDGELLPGILDDVAAVGIDLLPGSGDVQPRCSCPDTAQLCKHAAAVCYLMADELDRDPFEVFHLRGRPREELLAEMRSTRRRLAAGASAETATGGAAAEGADGAQRAKPSRATRAKHAGGATRVAGSAVAALDGAALDGGALDGAGVAGAGVAKGPVVTVPARELFDRPEVDAAALFALGSPAPAAHPGHPPPLAVVPPRASGIDAADLHALATDAAARAWALGRGEGDGGLALSADRDLARRAAAAIGTRSFGELAKRSGLPSRHLLRHALAWRHGGEEGIEVLSDTWMPPDDVLEEGRAALADARIGADLGGGRAIKARGNSLIAGTVQLRVARSGRWYRLAKVAGHWEIEDGPAADPATLFAERA